MIELKLTLEDIEKQVDFARQWPLMEGISRWKEAVGTTMASDDVVGKLEIFKCVWRRRMNLY